MVKGIGPGAIALLVATFAASVVHADGFDAEAASARVQMRTAIGQMDGTVQRLRVLLREARAKQLKLACFDEALSRADVSLRNAKEHARAATDAFARRDVVSARREMSELGALRESSREASTIADTCAAGRLDFPAPETTVVRVYVEPRPSK